MPLLARTKPYPLPLLQTLQQNGVYLIGIGFSLTSLHHLTHKKAQQLVLPCAKVGCLLRIGRDNGVHHCGNSRHIGNLPQSPAVNNGIHLTTTMKKLFKDILGDLARDRLIFDSLD